MGSISRRFIQQQLPAPKFVPPAVITRWAIRLLTLTAMLVSGYLAWSAFAYADVIGCGNLGPLDCSEVLQSRWSHWIFIPVSVPAVSLYATLFVLSWFVGPRAPTRVARAAWLLVIVLSVTAAGAAVWFTLLQAFEIGSLCIYCLVIHVCALVTAALVTMNTGVELRARAMSSGCGILCLALLIVPQLLLDPPQKIQIDQVSRGDDTETVSLVVAPHQQQRDGLAQDEGIESEPSTVDKASPRKAAKSRIITVLDGKVELDAHKAPLLGSPDAKYVIVELFDYTCPHCRSMHSRLIAAMERYGEDQVAIMPMVLPLNAGCNKHILTTFASHKDACVIARQSLAIWLAAPALFTEYHGWLLDHESNPTATSAGRKAVEMIAPEEFFKALESEKIDLQMKANIKLFDLAQQGLIPKFLIGDKVISAKINSDEELFELFEKEIGIEPLP